VAGGLTRDAGCFLRALGFRLIQIEQGLRIDTPAYTCENTHLWRDYTPPASPAPVAAMPKYFCDYCDTYLTHDSPSVRKTHCSGRKHKENVKIYYQKWMEEQAQSLIDATTAAFKAGKIANNPFAAGKGGREGQGATIPPPANMGGPQVRPQQALGPRGPLMGPMYGPGMPGPMMGPGAPMMGPGGPMMGPGMRPPMGPMGGPMLMMGGPRPPMMMGPNMQN